MKLLSLTFILSAIILTSCCKEKCMEYECIKEGQVYTEQNCDQGMGPGNETQQVWIKNLKEEKGYEEVNCRNVKLKLFVVLIS